MLGAQAYLVAAFGLDPAVWTRTGTGDGPPLPFRRMQGRLAAVFPPAAQPPSPLGPPTLLSSPRGFDVNELLGFAFPSSIRLFDPSRSAAAGAAAPPPAQLPAQQRTLRVTPVPPQQWDAAARSAASGLAFLAPVHGAEPTMPRTGAAGTPAAIHSFTLPSGQCGSVLTRWHRVEDAERVGLMRLQLAVAELQRSEGETAAAAAAASAASASSSGSSSASEEEEQQQQQKQHRRAARSSSTGEHVWAPDELAAWAAACAVADASDGSAASNILSSAAGCWEPSALVVVMDQPLFESMRAVLHSLDRYLLPMQRLDAAAGALLYAALRVQEARLQDPAMWSFRVEEAVGEGEEGQAAEGEASLPQQHSWRSVPCGLISLPASLPSAASTSASASSSSLAAAAAPAAAVPPLPLLIAAPQATLTTLLGALLPWVPPASAAHSLVVFPPSHELSWELPCTNWRCQECERKVRGVTRGQVKQLYVNYRGHVAAAAAAAGGSGGGRRHKPPPPLARSIRCINTLACLDCTSRMLGIEQPSPGSSSSSSSGGGDADPLLPFLPLDDCAVPSWGPLPPTPPLASAQATAPPFSPLPSAPLPFLLPAQGLGFPAHDFDPRPLFAMVQPRNIISIVTALLMERKVLLICKDTSIRLDIMYTLISLMHPMKWCGTMVPLIPPGLKRELNPIPTLAECFMPVFAGASPDSVRSCDPSLYYAPAIKKWTDLPKYSDEEVDRAMQQPRRLAGGGGAQPHQRHMHEHLPQDCNSSASGIGKEAAAGREPWSPPPPRWWLRYAHLLDISVGEWALADATAHAKEVEAAAAAAAAAAAGGGPGGERDGAGHPSPHGTSSGGEADAPAAAAWVEGAPIKEVMTLVDASIMATVSMGMHIPAASENETDSEVGAGGASGGLGSSSGGSGGGGGGGGGDGGSAAAAAAREEAIPKDSSSHFIIIDVDADAISPGFLPPSHILPPRLSLRLWKACAMFAPHWSWARLGGAVPPALPLFPPTALRSETDAAQELAAEMRQRAAAHGVSAKGLIRQLGKEAQSSSSGSASAMHSSSLAPAGGDADDSGLGIDGIFRFNAIFSPASSAHPAEQVAPDSSAVSEFLSGPAPRGSGSSEVAASAASSKRGGGLFSMWGSSKRSSSSSTAISSSASSSSGGSTSSKLAPRLKRDGAGASIRTLDYVNSDEELEEEGEDIFFSDSWREDGALAGRGAPSSAVGSLAVLAEGEEGEEEGVGGSQLDHQQQLEEEKEEECLQLEGVAHSPVAAAAAAAQSTTSSLACGEDTSPIPLLPPWALWRARMTAHQQPIARLLEDPSSELTGARILPLLVGQGKPLRLLVPEPTLYFSRIRKAFLSTWVSLLKGYRLYTVLEERPSSALPAAAGGSASVRTASPSAESSHASPTLGARAGISPLPLSQLAPSDMGAGAAAEAAAAEAAASPSATLDDLAAASPKESLAQQREREIMKMARPFFAALGPSAAAAPATFLSSSIESLSGLGDGWNDGSGDIGLGWEGCTPGGAGEGAPSSLQWPPSPVAQSPRGDSSGSDGGGEGAAPPLAPAAEGLLPQRAASAETPAVVAGAAPAAGMPPTPSEGAAVATASAAAALPPLAPLSFATPTAKGTRRRARGDTVVNIGDSNFLLMSPEYAAAYQASIKAEECEAGAGAGAAAFSSSSGSSSSSSGSSSGSSTAESARDRSGSDGSGSGSGRTGMLNMVTVTPAASEDGAGGSIKINWDREAFLLLETPAVLVGARQLRVSPLLEQLSQTTHWNLFIFDRFGAWESIRRYLLQLRAWKLALNEGKRVAASLAAAQPPGTRTVLCYPRPPAPPPIPQPDSFDRACFKRLAVRTWRHSKLASAPLAGVLWKAMRGTLCKAWSQRYVQLSTDGNLAYYGNPAAIQAAEARLTAACAERSRAFAVSLMAGGGGGAGGGGAGAAAAAAAAIALAAATSAAATAEADLTSVLRSSLRDTFRLIPGKTILRVPPPTARMLAAVASGTEAQLAFTNDGTTMPTFFPLQLINPPSLSDSAFLPHASDGGGGGGGSGRLGSKTGDSLTLCLPSAEARRSWILHFRAHLRDLSKGVPEWMFSTRQQQQQALQHQQSGMVMDPFLSMLYLGEAESFADAFLEALGADGSSSAAGGAGGAGAAAAAAAAAVVTVTSACVPSGRLRATSIPSASELLAIGSEGAGSGGGGSGGSGSSLQAQSSAQEYRSQLNSYYSRVASLTTSRDKEKST